eukprot:1893255-Prymnesium_polylepis.1
MCTLLDRKSLRGTFANTTLTQADGAWSRVCGQWPHAPAGRRQGSTCPCCVAVSPEHTAQTRALFRSLLGAPIFLWLRARRPSCAWASPACCGLRANQLS